MKHRTGWIGLYGLLAICAVRCLPAAAAELPDGSLYRDYDPAGWYLQSEPGLRAQHRARINAALIRNPRNVAALIQRAYMFLDGGDKERALRDFNAAAALVEPGSDHERNLLWSRGWAEYDLGQFDDTLRDWQRAVALHGGHPVWAGYSYALLYWTMGQQDAALAWFDVAVASAPDWGTAEGVEARIHFWSPAQQERMRALYARWKAGRDVG